LALTALAVVAGVAEGMAKGPLLLRQPEMARMVVAMDKAIILERTPTERSASFGPEPTVNSHLLTLEI
jgi:hypothetical protein